MAYVGNKKQILVFIDTNLLWNETVDFHIFGTAFLNQIITLRNFFENEIDSTRMMIIFPQTVIRERHKQKFDKLNEEIEKAIDTIVVLEQNKKFKNQKAIEELKDIKINLKKTIESDSKKFLGENKIIVAPECPKDYFEKIVEKAYNKEPPFKNKNSDGFKDALLWYSIVDYLKNIKLGEEDSIFFFTSNKKDFESEVNLHEFKKIIKKDLHIIDFNLKPKQIFDSEHKKFLQYTLKEAQTLNITEIEVKYSEFEKEWVIEKIFAKPFPSNLVSLLGKINAERKNCKKIVKEQIFKLLENFAFNVDVTRINFKFIKLPSIEKITVFLSVSDCIALPDRIYEIEHVNVVFDDSEENFDPKNENFCSVEILSKTDGTHDQKI